jgi:plastocyanin
MQVFARRVGARACIAAAVFISVGGMASSALDSLHYRVSQKQRVFQPSELEIRKGETVQIVNDDSDLLHHLYIDSSWFKFDSGDQEPGSKTDITFTVPGTFTVLCGIHPKMKLVVRVN